MIKLDRFITQASNYLAFPTKKDEVMNKTIENLKELIDKEDLTIYEISKDIDLSHTAIKNLTDGKVENPSRKTLRKIKSYIFHYHEQNDGVYDEVELKKESDQFVSNQLLEKLVLENIRLNRELLESKNEIIILLKKYKEK